MIELDDFDRKILAALQRDGRITNVALAETVALSPSQCARRLQRLEEAGAVRGYGAFLDPAALGLGITALVTVTLEKHARANISEFREIVSEGRRSSNAWRSPAMATSSCASSPAICPASRSS